MKTVNVGEALKSLDGTFLEREIRVQRTRTTINRRGDEVHTPVTVVFHVIDFLGLALIETKTLVTLFRVFKQTRVKTVTAESRDGGLAIRFDRAYYFLKGADP